MATGMFHTAKQLVFARLRARGIHDGVELKMAALAQLYGDELTESQRAAHIVNTGGEEEPTDWMNERF